MFLRPFAVFVTHVAVQRLHLPPQLASMLQARFCRA